MSSIDLTLEAVHDWDYDKMSVKDVSLTSQDHSIDFAQVESRTKGSFSERVKEAAVRGYLCDYLVDSLVYVTGPSEAARAAASSYWESRRNISYGSGVAAFVIGIAVMSGTAIMNSPTAVVVGVVTLVAAAFFGAMMVSKGVEAGDQIHKWSAHPAQSVADERAHAYEHGFFYVMRHDLQGAYVSNNRPQGVLHPSEVTWIYERDLSKVMDTVKTLAERQTMTEAEKAEWAAKLLVFNLIIPQAIKYAYETTSPKRQILETFAHSFEAVKQDIGSLQTEHAAAKSQVRTKTWAQLDEIERQRRDALAAPLAIRNMANDRAWESRVNRIKELEEGGDREPIIKEYEQTVESNNLLYNAAVFPINKYYNEWRKGIEDWQAETLAHIDAQKDAALAPFLVPLLSLYRAAYESWERGSLEEDPYDQWNKPLSPFNNNRPAPSAPPQSSMEASSAA